MDNPLKRLAGSEGDVDDMKLNVGSPVSSLCGHIMSRFSRSILVWIFISVVLGIAASAQAGSDTVQTGPVTEMKAVAADIAGGTGSAKTEVEDELDITADTVEMDFEKRQAVFEGNVKVTDKSLILTASKMIVYMTEQDELKYIEATGNVLIREVGTNKTATAGRAEFDVQKDTIVLLEDPSVSEGIRGKITEAEKITYYRNEQRFVFTGRPTLKIRMPKKGEGEDGTSLLSPGTLKNSRSTEGNE